MGAVLLVEDDESLSDLLKHLLSRMKVRVLHELCQQLRALAPGLPLLLTSGRDQRALQAVFAAGGPCSFLAKPYMPAEVMGRVKMMLTKPA